MELGSILMFVAVGIMCIGPLALLVLGVPLFILYNLPPRVIKKVAARLDIPCHKDGLLFRKAAEGEVDGARVRLTQGQRLEWESVCVNVDSPGGKLGAYRVNKSRWTMDTFFAKPIKTGDPNFDGSVFIAGPGPYALGRLTQEIREALEYIVRLPDFSWWADGLIIRVAPSHNLFRRDLPTYVEFAVRKMATVCSRLGEREATRADLFRLMITDPVRAVREQAELVLEKELPELTSEETEILKAGLQNETWDIVGACAHFLGEAAVPYLSERLASVPTPWPDEAIEAVARINSPAITGLLEKAARYHPAALEALGRFGDARHVPDILNTLSVSTQEKIKEACAEALEQLADSRAEDALVALVREESGARVRLAAVKALRTCGTLNAVEALHPLTTGLGIGSIRSEAKRSIAELQSRYGRGEGGELCLAETDTATGALSVTTDRHEGLLAMAAETEAGKMTATVELGVVIGDEGVHEREAAVDHEAGPRQEGALAGRQDLEHEADLGKKRTLHQQQLKSGF